MRNWKKILKAILFPPSVILYVLVPLSMVLLVYSFSAANTSEVISILSYAMSFYTLMAVCIRIPEIIRFVKRFKQENKYVIRYTSDVRLRMNISLCGSLLFNAAYAVFQLCLGIYHASIWFYAMAGYYFLLAAMRLLLAHHTKNCAPGEKMRSELKKYHFCGICLLVMNLALSVIIIYIVWQGRTFRHHEITTIAMAAYTFTSLTMAIINAAKYRKYQSPVYSAAKTISLVAATVSMLTL